MKGHPPNWQKTDSAGSSFFGTREKEFTISHMAYSGGNLKLQTLLDRKKKKQIKHFMFFQELQIEKKEKKQMEFSMLLMYSVGINYCRCENIYHKKNLHNLIEKRSE